VGESFPWGNRTNLRGGLSPWGREKKKKGKKETLFGNPREKPWARKPKGGAVFQKKKNATGGRENKPSKGARSVRGGGEGRSLSEKKKSSRRKKRGGRSPLAGGETRSLNPSGGKGQPAQKLLYMKW